ncbi:MAG TPA: multidrug ABC transporter ATP-binding protein [Gammaproteobacteria bacterium]|nr:multidrug ABC transporter ATP-binding protein [Gammaproteobacteria bacterium]
MPLTASLTINKLTKRFGDFTAVDKLDLALQPGEIFGLLGPNAAGKTTTIRMLAGIIRPSSGSANILGLDLFKDLNEIKSRIGYVAQHFALYPELTVTENLVFYSGLYSSDDPQRQAELLDQYGLTPYANRHAGQLSGGYMRRLSMVCALSHDPELIFLDEPTAGIDPVTRKELWDLFYDLAMAGKTLFVTTHYMEEAERCHQLAFLSHGKCVANDTPDEIKKMLDHKQIYTFDAGHEPAMLKGLNHLEGVDVINRFGNTMRLVADESLTLDKLTTFLNTWPSEDYVPVQASANLEDVFITLTTGESE